MTRLILDAIFGRKLSRQTAGYLTDATLAPVRASREQANKLLRNISSTSEPSVTLGQTGWKQDVSIPIKKILTAHATVSGGTGSGKSSFALLILKALIQQFPQNRSMGFGILDPKQELFTAALGLLSQRLDELNSQDVRLAEELRRRVIVLDFSSRDPISPYNILSRGQNTEPDFFAASRADLLLDLLDSGDGLSIAASALLQKAVLLLSEFNLPITWLDELLYNESFRTRLINSSENSDAAGYFTRNFPTLPKQTVAALSRRITSLFSSEGVRQALAGTTVSFRRGCVTAGERG